VRYAFARAAARRRQLTLCHKTNVLTFAGDLWQRSVAEVGAEFPDVEVDYVHVDAACLYLVTSPERFDVMVTDNLFGDIVTDLGAAVQGGPGLAASANLNPEGRYPSLFEAVHGSAPDIVGAGIANPLASIWSGALMLTHLGWEAWGDAVLEAIVSSCADPATRTRDVGGSATTQAVGDAVALALRPPPA
jgi:3-isopropylmalate dehydrogenase